MPVSENDIDRLEAKHAERLLDIAVFAIKTPYDSDAAHDEAMDAVEKFLFEHADWVDVPATAISDIAYGMASRAVPLRRPDLRA